METHQPYVQKRVERKRSWKVQYDPVASVVPRSLEKAISSALGTEMLGCQVTRFQPNYGQIDERR